jgi:hypothetical protein
MSSAVCRRTSVKAVGPINIILGLWLLLSVACGNKGSSSPSRDAMLCTDIDCEDLFAAQVFVDAGTVPSGTQTLNVVADGVSMSCTFVFPPDLSNNSGGQCSGALSVVVQPARTCTTGSGDGAVTEKCDALSGQFVELILFRGTPQSVQVQQTAGGTIIMDESVTPSYQTNEPNGPGCSPVCEQAAVQWTIP